MNRLDQIDRKLEDISHTLVKQHAVLDEHIKRTEALELQTDELKKFIFEIKGALKLISGALIVIEILSKLWH